jgi:polyketide biosynthesis enoyl-CoA hydratase PksH
MTAAPARLRLTIRDERGTVRLTPENVERLLATLDGDRDAGIVTLEGCGGAFCDGMDLAELVRHDGDVASALDRFARLLHALATTPRPVVALVDGSAVGGGVGLAAAADLVLATPRATFGLPEALFGLIPAVAFPAIARRVGPARARWLAMSAATLSAADAMRLGLVDDVVDDLEAAYARHARRLERLDARAMAAVKSMSAEYEHALETYHARAATAFAHLLATGEARDRIGRFLAGDTPWPDGGVS